MKNADTLVLGLAALAVYLIVRKAPGGLAGLIPGTANGRAAVAPTTEVLNAAGLPWDNGWRYYSDGTSISPEGAYYQGGQLVWKP